MTLYEALYDSIISSSDVEYNQSVAERRKREWQTAEAPNMTSGREAGRLM
jgi:hypothetical protein